MSLTKFLKDIRYHQGNADKPVMTAQQLKELFDQAGVDIKEYINDTLTKEIDLALEQKANISNIYDKSEVYSKIETDTNYVKNGDIYIITYTHHGEDTEKRIDLPSYFNSSNLCVLCAEENSETDGRDPTYIKPYTSWFISRDQDFNNNYLDHLTLCLYQVESYSSYKFVLMKIS